LIPAYIKIDCRIVSNLPSSSSPSLAGSLSPASSSSPAGLSSPAGPWSPANSSSPAGSSSLAKFSSPASSLSPASSSSPAYTGPSSSHMRRGAIIGGTIGGITTLAGFVLFIFLVLHRRQRSSHGEPPYMNVYHHPNQMPFTNHDGLIAALRSQLLQPMREHPGVHMLNLNECKL
jgi:hypothetical protein